MNESHSQPGYLRRVLRRFVPTHFRNPIKLASRLLKTGDPAALFAMAGAVMGVAATPLDIVLSSSERKRYAIEATSSRPLTFVCGGPRAGTTCTAQFLAAHLPVSHFTNLSSLFPRSPITAQRMFLGTSCRMRSPTKNFYGKTSGFTGMNDALYVWDRWLGEDREHPHFELSTEEAIRMKRFFAAWERTFADPLLAKCNSLNAVAHTVAAALENSHFICVIRDPLYMAQSLYLARQMIHGDLTHPYGLTSPESEDADDPITSVCKQVAYHQNLSRTQAERLGPERFFVVSYESLSTDPTRLTRHVACNILGLSAEVLTNQVLPPPLNRNRWRLEPGLRPEFEKRLAELSLEPAPETHP